MVKQRLSPELLHRIKALKQQGFNVYITSDSAGVIVHIRKKASEISTPTTY